MNDMWTWGLPGPHDLDKIVIVSPHLDDAVLGCSHLMARHPGATVITVLMPAWAATSASVGVEPLKMTRVSLPESLSWCSSSRGVYSGFTFTCTAPARRMPMQTIGKARRLGSITATRSPFFTPRRCCSQAAKAADWRSTSAKLRVWPKARKAGLSA